LKQCFRTDDNLESVKSTGIWGRTLEYLGKATTHIGILGLKRWCIRNGIIERFFLKDSSNENINEFQDHKCTSDASANGKGTGQCKVNLKNNNPQDVSYNLRPGRNLKTNRRYFNEFFDCNQSKRHRKITKYDSDATNVAACNQKDVLQENEDDSANELTLKNNKDQSIHETNDAEDNAGNTDLVQDIAACNQKDVLQENEDDSANELTFKNNKDQSNHETNDAEDNEGNADLFEDEASYTTLENCCKDNDNAGYNNPFSRETLEDVVGVTSLESYFTKTVPESGHFFISEDKWTKLKEGQVGRCFSSSEWENIICDGIKGYNPYCVYMFRWHKVSIAKKRKMLTKPIFRGEAICKFPECKNNMTFSMDHSRKVTFTIDKRVKHAMEESFARPIRGERRKNLRDKFRDGPKPFKCYMENFNAAENEVKLAGNFSDFGNSPQIFQKIASESRSTHVLEKSEFESLLKLAEEMVANSNSKKLPGFIRQISIYPPFVMYWNEAGVRIWHDMAKNSTVFWDATGSVIRSKRKNPRLYYYEIACLNPTKGQNIIPVASLLSSLHSTPMIRFWLSEFRRAEKKIYGHGNTVMPNQINSDRSLVFIQAALSEFNNESMDDFRSRAWRIITGQASSSDLRKVIPHACLSHVMSSFKKVVKEIYKSNSDFGMYCFSLILNSKTLKEIKEYLTSVYQVLLSPVFDSQTKEQLDFINRKLFAFPPTPEMEKDTEENEDLEKDISMFTEFAHASRLTEEDYLNRSTTNAFYNMSDEILQAVQKKISQSTNHKAHENRYQSAALVDKIHKLFMPTAPIWSDLLIGDLSRHGKSKPYQDCQNSNTPIRGNTSIEKRFQILKDIMFGGKPIHRLDEFSGRLKIHTETLQNMAIVKSIKTQRADKKGRSIKTVQEEWSKKQKSSNVKSCGKYQKPPGKEFSTGNSKKEKQQDLPPGKDCFKGNNVKSKQEETLSGQDYSSDNCKKRKQQDSPPGNDSSKYNSAKRKQEESLPGKDSSSDNYGKRKQLDSLPENDCSKDNDGNRKQDNYIFTEMSTKQPTFKENTGKHTIASKMFSETCSENHIHKCDQDIQQLLRRGGCIAQRLLLTADIESASKEKDIMIRRTYGLINTGNSCWFNAVISALYVTDVMQLALAKFNHDITFCPRLQKTLTIVNNLYNAMEVSQEDICVALDDVEEDFGIHANTQNDAHEFMTAMLSTLAGSLEYRNMKVIDNTSLIHVYQEFIFY
jgi:hypothetical protein